MRPVARDRYTSFVRRGAGGVGEVPSNRGHRGNTWLRNMAFYRPGRHQGRTSRVPEEPVAQRSDSTAQGAWLLGAVVLPIVVSLCLVPVRDDIDRSTAALVLMLPVVLVALLGGKLAAALAAITTPIAFDVLLTRPYHQLEMAVADDVEAATILLVVGSTVAALVTRLTGARTVASARARELRALEMAVAMSGRATESEAVAEACAALTELLDLRACRWAPDYHGAAYPVLSPEGELLGVETTTSDRAPLPDTGAEIPVHVHGHELGRFIIVPVSARPVSREERLVALTIADLFGRAHGGH